MEKPKIDLSKLKFNPIDGVGEKINDALGITVVDWKNIVKRVIELAEILIDREHLDVPPSKNIITAARNISENPISEDAIACIMYVLGHTGQKLKEENIALRHILVAILKSLAKHDPLEALKISMSVSKELSIEDEHIEAKLEAIKNGEMPEDCLKCDEGDCPVKQLTVVN